MPAPEKRSNRLMAVIRSILPNATWDGIKKAITDSPRYYGSVVGWWTLLSAASFALYLRLRGIPSDLLGILIIAFLLFLFLSISFVFGKLKGRESTPAIETAPPSIEIAPTDETKHAREVKELHSRIKELETEKDANKWLLDLAEREKYSIQTAVIITGVKVLLKPDNEPNPYVDFVFTVFNGSVYTISLEFDLSRSIWFTGSELSGRVKLEANEVIYAAHTDFKSFVVRLILTPTETEMIKNAPYPNDVFSFGELRATIIGSDQPSDVRAARLFLPSIHKDGQLKKGG